MIPLHSYHNKTVGVFGLGKAGFATVASLVAGGAKIFAWDDGEASREKVRAQFGKQCTLVPIRQWPWEDMECIVVSPGVPLNFPNPHPVVRLARQRSCKIVGDIALLQEAQPDATYIGITGTNGKSTTTALVAHILTVAGKTLQMGGNIGTSALALEPLGKEGIYVLELSSYQLDLSPDIHMDVGILLNISPDHLDRHGSMEGYIDAKMHIFEGQGKKDKAIIAIDDAYTTSLAQEWPEKYPSGLIKIAREKNAEAKIYAHASQIHDSSGALNIFIGNYARAAALQGPHNAQNAAVAYAACRAVGVSPEKIISAMETYPGLSHRMQPIGNLGSIRFINDSKATNAESTKYALQAFNTIYWIAGGVPKSEGIVPLVPHMGAVKHAYLIGQSTDAFAHTLEGQVPYTQSNTLEQAVYQAIYQAEQDNISDAVILLSPACASFDQYPNFEARGEHFTALVQQWIASIQQNETFSHAA